MFQFSGFATYTYGFSARLFGHPGINARLTTPPGFSQSSTPFIAFWCQDIPHTPLVAWPDCSYPRPVLIFINAEFGMNTRSALFDPRYWNSVGL